jgi:holo-[acyl-carrier protein] synthase
MIVGLGHDLVNIERIEAALERHEARFLARSFTPDEIALADRVPPCAATLAKRWAAKEACAKALGTGIGRGFSMTDIEVVRDDLGAPSLLLHGGAVDRLAQITPTGHRSSLHLRCPTICPGPAPR